MKIAITSVYANPLHPGHIECLELSKDIADELWVIVNNDRQAELKRGVPSFQDEAYRVRVVGALKPVDRVVLSVDTDPSVVATLRMIIEELKGREDVDEIIFTKGGDRFAYEIPERAVLEEYGVGIVDGLGAKTHNSSAYVVMGENG
jgi:cytidyltransferase-like protein